MSHLFSPITLRQVTLRNRLVVPPMHQYSGHDGHITDWHVMNAGRFAAGGAGLVIVESTKVERRGCGTLGDLGIWDDSFIPGLKRLADIIRDCGAVAGIQLSHCGRKARTTRIWEGTQPLSPQDVDDPTWIPVAPSAIAQSERWPVPHELSTVEVAELVEEWGRAARRAAAAGYDVVEIQACHGYLLHQFLSAVSNHRTDRYGGTAENRARLLLEITEAVRRVWSDDKPVFVRLSVRDDAGWEARDSIPLARELHRLGVDVIDCSSGGIIDRKPVGQPSAGYQVDLARLLRREAAVATMAVGLITDPHHAEAILAAGDADLVAVGRAVLAEPNWPFLAAQKLGEEDPYALLPIQQAFWLRSRATRGWTPYAPS